MGLGYCCCASESCGNSGFPLKITSYHGRSATTASKYFNLDYFRQRKNDQQLSGSKLRIANYIYDIDASSEYIAMACGSRGVRFSSRSGDTDNSSYRFRDQGTFMQSKRGMDYGGFTEFNGAGSSTINRGTFFAGDQLGDRYGFEQKQFSGVYGVCISGNYLITANGTDGVWLLDLNSASSATGGFGLGGNSGVQLLGGRSDTIINNVKLHDGTLYVGTCGYDKPKLSYSNSILQGRYQPEYKSDNKAFKGSYSQSGVFVYNFEKLLSGDEGSFLKNVSTNGKNVNSISASKGKVYIATGKRHSIFDGLYGGGELIKIEKNSSTGRIQSSSAYVSAVGSILDVDTDGDDVYCIDSSYGVIKNGSRWIEVMNGSSPSSELQNSISPCTDPFITCFYNTGGFFGRVIRYSGAYSAKIINLFGNATRPSLSTNPTLSREILQVCPPYNEAYKTRETIGIFPSSIKVTKKSICVGLLQGGIAVYDKNNGALQAHHASIMKKQPCDYFKTRADNNSDYDANYEYTLSIGKMACMGDFLYAIDSVQYVANGAGPGVYSPIERTSDVMTKTVLIKGFQAATGIVELQMTG